MYLLFAGRHFYPFGGFDDFIGIADEIQSGKLFIEEHEEGYEWAQVVDVKTLNIILKGSVGLGFAAPKKWEWEKQ